MANPDEQRRGTSMPGGVADVDQAAGWDGDDAFGFVRTLGMTRGMLDGLDNRATARALEALRTTLAAHDRGRGVLFDSWAWRITARRP